MTRRPGHGGKVHYDGVKNEECEIIIYGMGPATSDVGHQHHAVTPGHVTVPEGSFRVGAH